MGSSSTDPRAALIGQVSALLHAGERMDAARLIAEYSGGPRPETDAQALEYCCSLLRWALDSGRYVWAAQLLWPRDLFDPRPRATQMIWRALESSSAVLLMGAASMSKSYSTGVWLLLDWLRDPEYTSVYLVGPTEEHLSSNLFAHLVSMHSQASLPLPGTAAKLWLGLDRRRRKSAIQGVVIPQGSARAGRLQGRKRFPRRAPHPKFGTLSRIRFFLDELERIPTGVWRDLDNVFANLSGGGEQDVEGFKLIGAFNPEDIAGPVAGRCEPEKGWDSFDPETDETWVSKRGWTVVRLDAAKCENVVEGRVVYPGLQTREGLESIIRNSGGKDSPGYWSMARACFPPAGGVYSVIPPSLLHRARGEYVWAEAPVRCAGVDIALEGRDRAVMAVGSFGRAVGVRVQGREELFTGPDGARGLRWGLQLEQCVELPRGDTVAVVRAIQQTAQRLGVAPGWLIVDRTGNGAGVHDMLRSVWSPEVQGLNGNHSASELRILQEDIMTPREEYARAINEVWFAAKKWLEHGFFRILDTAWTEELVRELTGRRYYPGRQNRVETKLEYKLRGNPSPHYADAVTLLLHGVRMASRVVPSAASAEAGVLSGTELLDRGQDVEHNVIDTVALTWSQGIEDPDPELPGRSPLASLWQEIHAVPVIGTSLWDDNDEI